MEIAINVTGWVLFGIWAFVAGIPTLWLATRSLKRHSDKQPDPAEWPLVSLIVPARDEGHKIEAGLRSLLASDYPNFEIIAIDDRSRDETGAIMDRLAAVSPLTFQGRPKLRVVHVTELPDGWLGKNHALQVGFQQSCGDWLLFTDGDVVHAPDTLRRAIRFVLARRLDHLPLYPDIAAEGILEAAFVACFGLIFAAGTQPWLIPTRVPHCYAGVGAFNLVRRSALTEAGGFEPIRLDILDDVKLGKLLKRTGFRAEVLRSGKLLNIRWQQSAWSCITGLEKNAFASTNYSVLQLLGVSGATCFVFCGPLVGSLLSESPHGYLAALVMSHFLFGFNARVFGHSFWLFLLTIPASLAFVFAFLRSGWITLRQGGVKWRETFYPLPLLKKHLYF